MIALTDREIARTAFKVNARIPVYPVGTGPTYHKCPYCKNSDTDRITEEVVLRRFQLIFVDMTIKVLNCHTCSSVFTCVL